MSATIYLSVPLMAFLLILQSAVLPHFPIFGVVPQILFLAALAWGLLNGVKEAAAWALVAGFFLDLFSLSPLGVTSMAAMAAVSAAVIIYRSFPDSRILMPAILGAVGTLFFWFVYLLLLRIIMPLLVNGLDFLGLAQIAGSTRAPGLLDSISRGYGLNGSILQLVLQTALVHAFLMLPLFGAFQLIGRLRNPRRVEV
jgi:rod shape-determining protein MreD